jgi:6-phosphogluconate dehydrogenase
VRIPVRVSDVVRSLSGSGVVAAVALFLTRAGRAIDGGCYRSSTRRFTQHNGLNFIGIGAAGLGEGTADGFSRVGVREPDRRFERRLNRYPTLTRVGNKMAVT